MTRTTGTASDTAREWAGETAEDAVGGTDGGRAEGSTGDTGWETARETAPGTGADAGALAAAACPWSVRDAGGRRKGRRAALEVYEYGELLDVVVASRLSPQLLRGARRGSRGGRDLALAWGRRSAEGPLPVVEFTGVRRPLRRRTWVPVPAVAVSGEFWLARAEGPFRTVRVRDASGDCPAERLRLVRARGVGGADDADCSNCSNCAACSDSPEYPHEASAFVDGGAA
ncbi:hypothetical protein [Streptomyces sp. CB03911]|uniref:hypothetical protein n=1 Tax=Streptomyces sp. CB03911 TaxID=1804758 RepID=UPI0018FECFF4|nr:hypothetical protein [Streptomyces sp. CB03911]